MRASTLISTLAVAAPAVLAQSNSTNATSLCDKYAKALFKVSNGTTQYTLLTALVNTAVIGNYTKDPAPMNAVTGILNNGTYQGRNVSLLKYFDGMLASTNQGGDSGVSVNFLDDGGATPLTMNMPANGTESNQYMLLTHLYSYFGALLGCSAYGKDDAFPAYAGSNSQYNVHKFMDLSHDEVNYFIQEVGLAATSFGVSAEDATMVGESLNKVFNYKCSPPAVVIPDKQAALQAICIADDCPTATDAVCSQYTDTIAEPVAANSTNMGSNMTSSGDSPSGTESGSPSGTESGSPSGTETGGADSTGAASINGLGAVFMGFAGLAALAAGL